MTTTPKQCYPKPLLKWVGGKTQIIHSLLDDFPAEINNYYELFLGGGSVLFALLSCIQQGRITLRGNIYAYDVNEPLIHMYKNIQLKPDELYTELQLLKADFQSCGDDGKLNRKPTSLEEAKVLHENYYYWIRAMYNNLSVADKNTPAGSAMFLFLNKTCFRGVFRVGPHGFNVPYGHSKNPEIINEEHLYEIHQLIQPVLFECRDCFDILKSIQWNTDDFVYLDPPYAPETNMSFVGYTENGFPLEQHEALFDQIHCITGNMMMSNADVSLVRKHFEDEEHYTITSLVCRRRIHSKKPGATANEVLIKNYCAHHLSNESK